MNDVYLTFFMRIDLSFRARSCDFNLRSKFFLAKIRFSEFLIWWVCSCLINRSTPLDVICLCINVSALSRLFCNTLTRMPRHWLSCELSEFNSVDGRFNTVDDSRLASELIFRVFDDINWGFGEDGWSSIGEMVIGLWWDNNWAQFFAARSKIVQCSVIFHIYLQNILCS